MSQPSSLQLSSPSEADRQRAPRTLVLCFDGTSNEFHGDKDTNVVLLFQALERSKPDQQLVYYQTGIGTYAPPGLFISWVGEKFAQMLDEAIAWYLEDHVLGGYKFLMNTYRPGDKICLFGYSRGAYTARALAGMLRVVGLLHPRNIEQVPFAYRIFKKAWEAFVIRMKDRTDPMGWIAKNFKSTFSRPVDVEFVGVWDTVGSVGFLPRSLQVHTERNKIVKHFRHALALDERRAKFPASYWKPGRQSTQVTNADDNKGIKGENQKDTKNHINSAVRTSKEVWFAGGHGDVGGGWESSAKMSQLSRIPFRWMIREAKECTSAILWDDEALQKFGVNKPDSTDAKGLAKYRNQEKEDALCKSYSPFRDSTIWYIWLLIEVLLPMWFSIEIWGWRVPILFPHLGRARKIQEPSHHVPTKIHSSVKTRLQHLSGYQNAAQWDPKFTEFVDEWALRPDVQ